MFDYFKYLFGRTCLNPGPLYRTIKYNFLRKNTERVDKKSVFFHTSFSIFDLHKTAKLIIEGSSTLGYKRYKHSALETSLVMGENSTLEIGSKAGGCNIYHGCDIQIFKNAKLKIGKCAINRGAQIICQDSITIGDDCMISRDVVIRDNDGGHKILIDNYKPTAPVIIGNHVWIGQGAIIMKGVKIGDGAIIGAGAFVATNVKANALVMPDPSRTFAKDVNWDY